MGNMYEKEPPSRYGTGNEAEMLLELIERAWLRYRISKTQLCEHVSRVVEPSSFNEIVL
jgi:hypothetical protein